MVTQKQKIDIDALLNPSNTDFRMVQILDEEGKVVNPDLMPDVSD